MIVIHAGAGSSPVVHPILAGCPSGPRSWSAKPLFAGSNPAPASNIRQAGDIMTTMYHVSVTENRCGILSRGLLASLDTTGHGAVFLADELPMEIDGFDIWAIDIEGLSLDEDWTGDPESGRWWMHFGNIDPCRIRLHLASS